MKLLGALVICGFVASARADATDPFSSPHGHPTFDPFAYAHAGPASDSSYARHGADTVSPESLAAYAPTALDPSVSRHLQALLDVQGAEAGLITARGDRMFFSWSVTGASQVWRQDGPMKYPVQLTAGEDSTTVVGLAPDDSFVVVSRESGGADAPGLYLLSPQGGQLRLIQHAAKVHTSLAFISDDSQSIYYRANDRDPASYAIYRYDVKTGATQLVFGEPGVWSVVDQRDGTWLMAKALGDAHVEISTYDVANRASLVILGRGESEDYQAAFGPKRGQVIVRTNKLGEFQRLYSFEGGALHALTLDQPHDVESFAIDRTRTRIYVAVNDGGHRILEVIDARTGKPIALPKLPLAELTTLSSLSPSGRFAQFTSGGSAMVPTTLVYDWQHERTTVWRVPATPEVGPKSFTKATLETFPARDGAQIPMYVRRPSACTDAAAPCPVIVQFHGGPAAQARPEFSPAAQAFVDAGFIVVWPNVRGSTGYGKTWLHADDGAKRLAVITDIEDCARYLRKAWAVNGIAPKLGITGASYGGYATLIAMTMFAGAYDAGAEAVGMVNLVTFLQSTAPDRRASTTLEYGDPVNDRLTLEQLSPVHYVDRIRGALLILQGVSDPRAPVGEALQLHDALVQRNASVRLILLSGTVRSRADVVTTLGHTIEFFRAQLE